jgi:hypothetical protein
VSVSYDEAEVFVGVEKLDRTGDGCHANVPFFENIAFLEIYK